MPEITWRQILSIQAPIARIPVTDETLRTILEFPPPLDGRLVDCTVDVPPADYQVLCELSESGGRHGVKAGVGPLGRRILAALVDGGPADNRALARCIGQPKRRVTDATGYLRRAGLVSKAHAKPITYTITDAGRERLAQAEKTL